MSVDFEFCIVEVYSGSELLSSQCFTNLAKAIQFISRHRSTTFGCYRYQLYLDDSKS